MFGYVTPLKCELKIKDFETYKALYCGLCFELQQHFGYFSKLFLNYDFVFVYMLSLALSNGACDFKRRRCNTNPLKHCTVAQCSETATYSAAALSASAYYKLKDDLHDERFFRKAASAFLLPAAAYANKAARNCNSQLCNYISQSCKTQAERERQPDISLDCAADSTALALAHVFSGLSEDKSVSRVLDRLGYMLGRFVYLADTADDLEKDLKKRRFNPLISRFSLTRNSSKDEIASALTFCREQLLLTQSEVADAYSLLNIEHFRPILDNIIYLGLPATAHKACLRKEKSK